MQDPVQNLLGGLGEPEQIAILQPDDAFVIPPGNATSALARSKKCSLRRAK
jgi:hypothetical protein